MRRREFLGVAFATVAWPLAAHAQEAQRVYRLAFLIQNRRATPHIAAFMDELRLAGFVEGQNLIVIPGFEVGNDQLTARAADIVQQRPDVIVTAGDRSTKAAQAATNIIPILGAGEDLVASGIVASLAKPGGNVTGVSMLSLGLDGKRQDLLIEAVPRMKRMAALGDRSQTDRNYPAHVNQLREAAKAHGIEFSDFSVSAPAQIAGAIADAKAWGADGINVLASPMLNVHRRTIFDRATALRLPAIYEFPEAAEDGGLIAYGQRQTEVYRQRAHMLVKLFNGAKPSDLPVEQPTRFEFVVNLTTAKMIGHELPAALVLRADKVIE